MIKKAPGKAYRKGISLVQIMRMFPDNETAEAWFVEKRWPDGPHCPSCGSHNVQTGAKHAMPFRCRERQCRKRFSVRIGTVMEGSNLDYQTWAIAIYLHLTSLKSVSSMKLHRDLGISQKSAWHLAHRLREAFGAGGSEFTGPVEADETYIGGIRKNMPKSKRKQITGRGAVGKTAVLGVKDRGSNEVRAKVVASTDAETLQGFIRENTEGGSVVYTDEALAYNGLAPDYGHEAVKHGVGEYVRGQAHTNGIESFWSMLKRAHKGTKISPKHLDRYVTEFAGKHDVRERDTLDQMAGVVTGMVGKQVRYGDLTADNGLDNGARGWERVTYPTSESPTS